MELRQSDITRARINNGKKVLKNNNYTVDDMVCFLLLDSPRMGISDILEDIYMEDIEDVRIYLCSELIK